MLVVAAAMLMAGVVPPLEDTGATPVTAVTPADAVATIAATVVFLVVPPCTKGTSSVPAKGVVAEGSSEIFTSAMMRLYS